MPLIWLTRWLQPERSRLHSLNFPLCQSACEWRRWRGVQKLTRLMRFFVRRWVVPLLWGPLLAAGIAAALWRPCAAGDAGGLAAVAAHFAAGALLWELTEYSLHRWVSRLLVPVLVASQTFLVGTFGIWRLSALLRELTECSLRRWVRVYGLRGQKAIRRWRAGGRLACVLSFQAGP